MLVESLIKWLIRNFVIVNLVLIVLGIISYMAVIDLLVFWTNWGGQIGEIGGVLEYHPFGRSLIYHVTKENVKGRLLFTFPDVPAYLLTALIILNAAALLARDLKETEPSGVYVQKLAFRNLIIGIFCLILYVWGTMMYIDQKLNYQFQIGGSVYYMFPLYVWVTHVNQGYIESSLNWHTPDFTLWLLLILVVSTVVIIRQQLGKLT